MTPPFLVNFSSSLHLALPVLSLVISMALVAEKKNNVTWKVRMAERGWRAPAPISLLLIVCMFSAITFPLAVTHDWIYALLSASVALAYLSEFLRQSSLSDAKIGLPISMTGVPLIVRLLGWIALSGSLAACLDQALQVAQGTLS